MMFINWGQNGSLTIKVLIGEEAVNNFITLITDVAFFSFRAVIGEIDEELDRNLDMPQIRAEPLNSVTHWPCREWDKWVVFNMGIECVL